jgi:hypothetical protein
MTWPVVSTTGLFLSSNRPAEQAYKNNRYLCRVYPTLIKNKINLNKILITFGKKLFIVSKILPNEKNVFTTFEACVFTGQQPYYS